MDESTAIKKFVVKQSIIFIVLAIVCAAVFYFFAQQHYFHFVPVIFAYFYVLNLATFYVLIKSSRLSMSEFSIRFMLISSGKFFGSLIFALAFIIFSREHLIPFLVIFIILYISSLFQLVQQFQTFQNQKKLD